MKTRKIMSLFAVMALLLTWLTLPVVAGSNFEPGGEPAAGIGFGTDTEYIPFDTGFTVIRAGGEENGILLASSGKGYGRSGNTRGYDDDSFDGYHESNHQSNQEGNQESNQENNQEDNGDDDDDDDDDDNDDD